MIKQKQRSKQQGFTLLELLIATLVFTMVLIVITACVMQFSKQFYKGSISNFTQNTSRSVMDDISRSIQFNSGDVVPLTISGVVRGYCIGDSKRYSFVLGRSLVGGAGYEHVLVADNVTSCGATTVPLDVTTLPPGLGAYPEARELMQSKMRLSNFEISETGGMYMIKLKVAYGEDDVLNNFGATNASCKLDAGLKYCAISELVTTVKKRVDG